MHHEDATSKPRKSSKRWITCGVITVILFCVGGLLLSGGFGALIALFGFEPEGLTVNIESPPTVETGRDFQIAVELGNTGSNVITVDEILLPNSLVEAAVISEITPPSTQQMEYGDQISYSFSLPIEPGSSSTVTFKFKALKAGDYHGSLDVSVGTRTKFTDLRVVITDTQPTSDRDVTTSIPSSTAGCIPFESVVQIIALIELDGEIQPGWAGSGSIITPDGLILTNAHVVLSDPYYQVNDLVVALTVAQDQPPEFSYYAEVLQADAALDIAIIRLTTDMEGNPLDHASLNLPAIPLGDSDQLQLGDPLTILGYPGIGGETITLTRGEVSGFTGDRNYGNRAFIKTSAAISGGNSGGLAANDQGELIGVPTEVGYGGEGEIVDCRALADTNNDGVIDDQDSCIPTGGFINALRPLSLALPQIEAARRGEKNIQEGATGYAQAAPSGEILFEDDFSDPNSGWIVYHDDEFSADYQNGEFLIDVKPENSTNSGIYDQYFGDVVVSVDARIDMATGVGDYGIICRFQDNDNFYALEISEDGYFSIWMLQSGDFSYLYEWEYFYTIPAGQTANITAACVGDMLSLAVNNVLLVEVTDSSFASGDVGLVAGTFETGGISVAFDNIVVQSP